MYRFATAMLKKSTDYGFRTGGSKILRFRVFESLRAALLEDLMNSSG